MIRATIISEWLTEPGGGGDRGMGQSSVGPVSIEEQEAVRSGYFIAHTLPRLHLLRGEMIYLAKQVLIGRRLSLKNVTWDRGSKTGGDIRVVQIRNVGSAHQVRRKDDGAVALFALVGNAEESAVAYVYENSEILVAERQ